MNIEELAKALKAKNKNYANVDDFKLVSSAIKANPGLSSKLNQESINRIKADAVQREQPPVEKNIPNPSPAPATSTEDKSLLEKASDLSRKTFGKAADIMFGGFGETAGKAIVGATESAAELIEGQRIPDEQKTGYSIDSDMPTKSDIIYTALETYPGGGFISKALSKIPGGAKIIETISKLPESAKKEGIDQWYKILNPTSKKTKALTRKIAPELAGQKLIIKNLDSLITTADAKTSSLGKQIDSFIKALPEETMIETKPAVEKLLETRSGYIVGGKVVDAKAISSIDEVLGIITQYGDEISAPDYRKIRKILDKSVRTANQGFTKDEGLSLITEAKETLANAMRDTLNKEFVDLAKLNREFNLWSNVGEVASATLERQIGQKGAFPFWASLAGGVTGGVGAGADGGFGEKITGAYIGAILGKKAIIFMQSPAYRSVKSATKIKIAEAIAEGNFKEAGLIIGKLIAEVNNLNE